MEMKIRERESGFDTGLVAQARLFKALAHPARLAILYYLADITSCMTGDIADELPLSRTTVNQHLKELRDAGLIKGTVEGARKNYCLDACGMDLLSAETDNIVKRLRSASQFC
jgi:DNA-binding transcriptional ArsR family regulator